MHSESSTLDQHLFQGLLPSQSLIFKFRSTLLPTSLNIARCSPRLGTYMSTLGHLTWSIHFSKSLKLGQAHITCTCAQPIPSRSPIICVFVTTCVVTHRQYQNIWRLSVRLLPSTMGRPSSPVNAIHYRKVTLLRMHFQSHRHGRQAQLTHIKSGRPLTADRRP